MLTTPSECCATFVWLSFLCGGFKDIAPIRPQRRDIELGDEEPDDVWERHDAFDEVPLIYADGPSSTVDVEVRGCDTAGAGRMEMVGEDFVVVTVSKLIVISDGTNHW